MASVTATLNLARQQLGSGLFDHAEDLCRRVLEMDPDHPDAFHLLGLISQRTGKADIAADLINTAIALNPHAAEYYYNLGVIFTAAAKQDAALKAYQAAVILKPDYAEALNNAGLILYERDMLAEAEALFQQAIGVKPDFTHAYYNLGKALQALGKPKAAIRAYDQVLTLLPDSAETRFNRSLALLLMGKFKEGWTQYEWRYRCIDNPSKSSAKADWQFWQGSLFDGKRLLVIDEQGIGDTLQFMRYLPMVKARGGTVGFETVKPLINLLRDFRGIDELWDRSSVKKFGPSFDLYAPLMSLPAIFNTELETIPAEVPYIFPDAAKVRLWERRLQKGRINVGIVWGGKSSDAYRQNKRSGLEHISLEWAGQPANRFASNRLTRLEYFAPLTKIPGIQLYGLQKGTAAAQIKEPSQRMDAINLGEEFNDFSDTAAVIANMDLVISVDTAVAHLAGAMAKPVWILIPFVADWRWLLDRDDSPWYPTARLFRQQTPQRWDDVFKRVADELQAWVGQQMIK